MTSHSAREHASGSTAFTGGPAPPPTPEEVAAFEAALREADARFLAAALAEGGMPISAGWRGPAAEPKSAPAGQTDALNRTAAPR